MFKTLNYTVKDRIAYINIHRPDALNALNGQVIEELYQAFTKVKEDDQVGGVILSGEGKAFVAGADIAAMSQMTPLEGRDFAIHGHRTMNFIETLEKPVIAAVNGFALGGGCELAMACDIRIASKNAKFGQPEVNLGIIPGFGGTQRLARLVGRGMAKYLIMTAEIIKADRALEIGLVEEVTTSEELIERATAVMETILSKAPVAVGIAKATINQGENLDMNTASNLEIEAFTGCCASVDKKEGMEAFLQKRPAKFQGK